MDFLGLLCHTVIERKGIWRGTRLLAPYTCNGPYLLLIRTLFITRSHLLFYFVLLLLLLIVFHTCSICFRTIYRLQMALGNRHFWTRISMFCMKTIKLIIRKVINVIYILMYSYTRILFVVLHEGWVCTQVYLQETCSDAHER